MVMFRPSPDHDKYVEEIETFLKQLTDDKFDLREWRRLWVAMNQIEWKGAILERKWSGEKRTRGKAPINTMRHDVIHLAIDLRLDIFPYENIIDFGIGSTQKLLDTLPLKIPYFKDTKFSSYLSEINSVLNSVEENGSKQTDILKLLREYAEHRDIITTCQFYSHEMVDYYKFLNQESVQFERQEIIKYLEIYEKLCVLYDRDMCLTSLLINLRDKGDRQSYSELRKNQREPQDKINHVKRFFPLLNEPYDRVLRNAGAHGDVITNKSEQTVSIFAEDNQPLKLYRYGDVIRITREMSALVASYKLIIVIIGNSSWKWIKQVLY